MTFSPLIAVAIALAVSMAGNVMLGRSYLAERDDATEARASAGQARDAAQQCDDGVRSLQAAAEARARTAETERDAALRRQRAAQATAAELLARAPKNPADLCASAQVQVNEWLSNRGPR